MEKEKMIPQEWEIEIKEKLSQIDEKELLDLAQDIAIRLAADLGQAKICVRDPEVLQEEVESLICGRIGRMAVMLDVLQLRYCDCADEELEFLKDVEKCLEE